MMDAEVKNGKAVRKLANRKRYERRYARHKPPSPSASYPAELRLTPYQKALVTIRGVPEYLQAVARMRFGAAGTWGHGKQPSGTTKGPGIRPLPRKYREDEDQPLLTRARPPGTKLVRHFIRHSGRESHYWRTAYAALTGKHYG